MAHPPRTKSLYLREWREHRRLTQEQVVARLEEIGGDVPKTAASISRLETGKQPYSQGVMEALADVYQCEVWELTGRNPAKEGQVIDFVSFTRGLDDSQIRQAMAVLRAMFGNDQK